MSDGLQVTIKYHSLKFKQFNGRSTDDLAVSVVMNDLQLLRVHVPSKQNIRREGDTFTLLWPFARKDPKIRNVRRY